ncbi:hypothetical protein ACGF5F_29560 [Streptomyces sp. NPDC047821]|uniref:hypothetical protein n=1 Tax=Streptomyces sp. NPDC047821 TaxID=3365488 RepID=UPI0037207138
MTACKSCGREPENGTETHWLGCEQTERRMMRSSRPGPVGTSTVDLAALDECEHDDCTKPKKEWSGRGARPKYCADGHK